MLRPEQVKYLKEIHKRGEGQSTTTECVLSSIELQNCSGERIEEDLAKDFARQIRLSTRKLEKTYVVKCQAKNAIFDRMQQILSSQRGVGGGSGSNDPPNEDPALHLSMLEVDNDEEAEDFICKMEEEIDIEKDDKTTQSSDKDISLSSTSGILDLCLNAELFILAFLMLARKFTIVAQNKKLQLVKNMLMGVWRRCIQKRYKVINFEKMPSSLEEQILGNALPEMQFADMKLLAGPRTGKAVYDLSRLESVFGKGEWYKAHYSMQSSVSKKKVVVHFYVEKISRIITDVKFKKTLGG